MFAVLLVREAGYNIGDIVRFEEGRFATLPEAEKHAADCRRVLDESHAAFEAAWDAFRAWEAANPPPATLDARLAWLDERAERYPAVDPPSTLGDRYEVAEG